MDFISGIIYTLMVIGIYKVYKKEKQNAVIEARARRNREAMVQWLKEQDKKSK